MFNRRFFFRYALGSASLVAGFAWLKKESVQAASKELDLDAFCLDYPYNSRCATFLPGTEATSPNGDPYMVSDLLANSESGDRIAAEGLDELTYLVITAGPMLANYGVSAKCTHLGCTVEWNAAESRFVCPCHGSQFDGLGQVVNGPASTPLALVTVTTNQDRVGLVDRPPAANPRQ